MEKVNLLIYNGIMHTYPLIPFDQSSHPFKLFVQIFREDNILCLNYTLKGEISLIKFSNPATHPQKKESLYETTCFELFLGNREGKYLEWNFSPSQDWCIFSFESYRKRSQEENEEKSLPIHCKQESDKFELSTSVNFLQAKETLGSSAKLKAGLSAVIEKKNGEKIYFALAHASKKPDFHDAKSFLVEI